ncbi:DUF6577 family protein [Proteiniclasticum ruminis]|uniref:DUF6577 family protein n=1 Tax=Proteiniclasticum ruminis TaxID=398199 RepID=UPI0028A5EBAA|nr:DUF6577 family protein [Proteiniclasticum ruminis]
MNDKLRAEEIKVYFGDKPFNSNDLYNFYANYEPDLKKTTFRWRVYTLKDNGVISTLKKGVYTTTRKKNFEPAIDKKLVSIFRKVKKQFPYTDMAIWDTSWLNNYMVHQKFTNNIILEVEKDAAPVVFAYLQELYRNVYLNPGKFEVEHYIVSGQKNIIIKNLMMTSPLTEREGLILPTIEKIMVDLFKDDELFAPYQGAELQNIFQEFFYTYNINQSTLRQYANKRHVRDRLIFFLEEETDIDEDKLLI